jgi:hypothetical protein
MKIILSLKTHHYLAKVSIFLIVVALIVVMVGCEEVPYNLTMAANPVEGGTATDLTAASPYTADTGVSIKAVAAAGFQFVNWGAPAGTFVDANMAATTFTMPALPVTVTANFEPCPFYGGSGTEGDPYQIADWCQLYNVRNYLDSSFILVNNLDSTTAGYTELASPTANGGRGWQPIGSILVVDPIARTGVFVDPFTGTFDGQGYEIRDLFINRPDEDGLGLFGGVDAGGVIEDVKMMDADVTGTDSLCVGILVGSNNGTLSSSYSSGSASGGRLVGGLIGVNVGSVSDSYSTATVSGIEGLGGLVGWNEEGDVSNSYATGSVTGSGEVGGLVGYNAMSGTVSDSYATGSVTGNYAGGLVGANDGDVSNSYSTGSVTGDNHVGGLVGWNDGTVSNSFWDTQTSGQATSDGGMGKPTAQMKDFDTFDGAGWDIIAVGCPGPCTPAFIWNICVDAYPFLCW